MWYLYSKTLPCIITDFLCFTDDIVTEPKRRRNVRIRNESNRPTTEANVVDFNDKTSAGNNGENMTDVFVESTYKQLCMAYSCAHKVIYQ